MNNDVENVKQKCKGIVDGFFASKKNSNCLLELEELLLSADDDCILPTIGTVSDIFVQVCSMNLLDSSLDYKKENYRLWLLNRLEDFTSHLLWYLSSENNEIQHAALCALMLFLELQSKHLAKDTPKDKQVFPRSLFVKIVSGMASKDLNQHHLIKVFEKYTIYFDIKLYLLKTLEVLFAESTEISDVFLQNCFLLLCSVKFPDNFDEATSTIVYQYESNKSFQLKEKPFRRLFSSVWKCFFNYELPPSLLKKVLCVLPEDVLPHLQNPCIMTDFFTNAYSKGGVVSLLALKGLYLLMQKYNLEYPDFFVKLYGLVDKNVINGKFNSMFFILLNHFLSSTHLPAHVVAAFVKKLSRLSLMSCTSSVIKILHLISNLYSNHASLNVMFHRTDITACDEDVFNCNATDPSESNALKSSLWEIKTLQSHINFEISCKAKIIAAKYPTFSRNISELAKVSLNNLYSRYRKRKFMDLDIVPMATCRPYKQKQKNICDTV